MGKLTTHILDIRDGKPGAAMNFCLYRLENHTHVLLGTFLSNLDGRTDKPLLEGDYLTIGEYQLEFNVGAYFGLNSGDSAPPFLGIVPIRFGISDASNHYHVPLLCSPWTYSTYRGS